ncbi:MAG: C40 family peptidase [Clostridia bacterium]|nr:C40 family peptidase [Clostridia bacterium]
MKITQNGRNRITAMILTVVLLMSISVPAMAETFSAIVTSSSMTVYKDAKLSQALATLEQDTVVRITAYSGSTAAISYKGRTGYAKVSDMQAVEDVAQKAVVKADATVYQTPTDGAKSAKVKKGAKLYVLATSEEWAEVEKDGAVGYIRLSDLTEADDDWQPVDSTTDSSTPAITATEGTVAVASMPVYQSASEGSKKLGTLKKGQKVNVVTWDSTWAYIELDGNYGYCAVTSLQKDEIVPDDDDDDDEPLTLAVTVAAAKLPVYKSESASSTKLGTLKKGQSVNLVSQNGTWAYIELDGHYGYCEAAGLSLSASPTISPTAAPSTEGSFRAQVNAESLTVYKTASTGAAKLLILDEDDEVNVIKWNDAWAYIEYEGIYGFCAVGSLTKPGDGATPVATAEPSLTGAVKATVTEESVMVYRLAGDTTTALGAVMWGDVLNVISVEDNWAYIEKDGKYGFISATALSAVAADPDDLPSDYKKADFEATVIDPDAVSYDNASTTANATPLDLGDTVVVIAYSTDLKWACVAAGSGMVYVPIKYLSRTEYQTVSGTGTAMQTLVKALLTYGYYDGTVTSTPDSSAITAAIKRFQAACGLDETGTADQALQRILYGGAAPKDPILSANLSNGDAGDMVSRLQMRLYALGYLTRAGSLDGEYGTTTANAVSLFQKGNGISVTGTANAATLKAMWSTGAVSRPSSVKAADDTSSSSGSSVVTPSGTVTLSSTYVTTMPSSLKSTTSSFSSGMSNAQKLEYVIYVAQSNLGKPYVYGATGTSSFDCSGLTQYSFKKAGVNLKRTAYSQGYDSAYTKISSISSLKRGDLIFFNTISDSDLCDHVGIYLGGNCFIHASSGGHKVVVSSVASGYYNRVFSWGRRILK